MSHSLLGTALGRYRIERMLGRGGMGAVYQATDSESGRIVAIKTMLVSTSENPEMVHRFEREARLAGEIDHPYVARVIDSGVAQDTRYLVMEFVNGRPLSELIKERGRSIWRESLDYVRQAAIGLQAAHKHGIIHRDIKPENIMITQEGTIKIVDFGLAKSENQDSLKTATGAVMGTPHYMSPEQATGRGVDHRSDIYSLGATMYHLLTGHTPFEADTPFAVIQKHITDEPRGIAHWNRDVPEPVAQICYRMLRKRQDERYQTYGHLISMLDDAIEGKQAPSMTMEVVDEEQARSIMQGERTDRKRMYIAGAVVLAIVAAAIGLMHRQSVQEAAEQEAEVQRRQTQGQGLDQAADGFRRDTMPMLHDINKYMKEQDAEVDKFQSRRERTNN